MKQLVLAVLMAGVAMAQFTISLPPQDQVSLFPFGSGVGSGSGWTFSVKDSKYGAKGDGITNDTLALQAAATACETAGGGVIFAPKGTYLATQWTVGSGCTIQGEGIGVTIFKCLAAEPNACIHASSGGKKALGPIAGTNNYGLPVTNVAFRDFTLDGNGTARMADPLGTNGYPRGLVVAHLSSNILVEHVRFVDGGSRALEVNPSRHVQVLHNTCDNSSRVVGREGDCLHIGVECNNGGREPPNWCDSPAKLDACRDIHVSGNTVNMAGDVSISTQFCSDVEISNNIVRGAESFACAVDADCGVNGVCAGGGLCTPTNDETGIEFVGSRFVRVTNNLVDKVRNYCLYSWALTDPFGHTWIPTDVSVNTLSCSRGTTTVNDVASLYLSSHVDSPAQNMTVSNSSFKDSPIETIIFGTQIIGGSIIGNVMYDVGRHQTNSGVESAILLGDGLGLVQNLTVVGNRVYGLAGVHTKYGLFQQGNVAGGTVIESNSFANVGTAPVRVLGFPIVLQPQVGFSQAQLGANIMALANQGSQVYCTDCTYDNATGLCNTGGSGTAGRLAYKRDQLSGSWCCESGPGLSTCG